MHIRCPHCRNPIEVVDDAELADITCPSCGSSFNLLPDETVSRHAAGQRTLGRFELVERIGLGAFGEVWTARDTELDRTVAIKLPRKGQLTTDEAESFLREARSAARLHHPSIVAVHEVGREEEQLFIVSDYVQGVTLADWLTARRPTPKEAAELCAKIADAVQHAHDHGVIHRDLKPSNIMLDDAGQPYIMDFGLAKRDAGEVTMTVEGKVLGTPAYMSPEQARGAAHDADERSDVYSLGVILFELLTGELPFRGNVRMLVHQVINEEAPGPRNLNNQVPADLNTVCLKCLEKDPDNRYATAGGFADELRRFLASEPIKARPVSRLERGWRWCKRNPLVAGLAGAVLASIASGLLGVTWEWRRAESEANRASVIADERERARLEAIMAKDLAQEEAEAKRQLLYISDMNLAQQAWDDANLGRVLSLLKRHVPQPGGQDLRRFEWFYLWRLCQQSKSKRTILNGNIVNCVCFSSDGQMLASAGTRAAKVWNWIDGKLRLLCEGKGHVRSVAFSADGTKLAFASGGRVHISDVSTGHLVRSRSSDEDLTESLAWSPDGSALALGGTDGTLVMWSWSTDAVVMSFDGHDDEVWSVAFSPDGTVLASASWDHTVRLWSVADGTETATLQGHEAWVMSVAFSPNGRTVASGSKDCTVKIWDIFTGDNLQTFTGHTGTVLSVAYSPDGTMVASGSQDNTVSIWDLAEGERSGRFVGHTSQVSCVDFSPDGRTLASGSWDGTVKQWDLTEPKQSEKVVAHEGAIRSMALTHDGLLATGGDDLTTKLWKVSTGRLLTSLHTGTPLVAVSSDGSTLATEDRNGSVVLWKAPNWRRSHTLSVSASSACFSRDGKELITGNGDGSISVWDVSKGELKTSFKGHTGSIPSIAFSPDEETLASASTDQTVRLWHLRTGHELFTFRGHSERVTGLAFCLKGELLASSSWDGTIRLWDLARGNERARLKGHGGPVLCLASSPSGYRLASGGGDRKVKVWDLATQQEVATLRAHTHWVASVAFSMDRTILVSGGYDHTFRLWPAATQAEVQLSQWWRDVMEDRR